MPSLSKKYKINYKRRYTISKNKKYRGHKSIKVYHTRVKRPSRKRKYYMGGDIEVPAINNIFPSGQSYQPNTDCLKKECDKHDDGGKKTPTCLNTRVVMNLFRQNLDASEQETMDTIDDNFTAEERKAHRFGDWRLNLGNACSGAEKPPGDDLNSARVRDLT